MTKEAPGQDGDPMPQYYNILFCTDFSEHANTAFLYAFDLAKKYDTFIHMLNVVTPLDPCGTLKQENGNGGGISEEDTLEDLTQQAIGALKVSYGSTLKANDIENYKVIVKIGTPDVEIIQYAKQNGIDIIILGALGRPEAERMTRVRTAANVSKFAPCQVVVIQNRREDD